MRPKPQGRARRRTDKARRQAAVLHPQLAGTQNPHLSGSVNISRKERESKWHASSKDGGHARWGMSLLQPGVKWLYGRQEGIGLGGPSAATHTPASNRKRASRRKRASPRPSHRQQICSDFAQVLSVHCVLRQALCLARCAEYRWCASGPFAGLSGKSNGSRATCTHSQQSCLGGQRTSKNPSQKPQLETLGRFWHVSPWTCWKLGAGHTHASPSEGLTNHAPHSLESPRSTITRYARGTPACNSAFCALERRLRRTRSKTAHSAEPRTSKSKVRCMRAAV